MPPSLRALTWPGDGMDLWNFTGVQQGERDPAERSSKVEGKDKVPLRARIRFEIRHGEEQRWRLGSGFTIPV